MRVRLMSDLHLEHAPMTVDWCGEDVLVLAGDVAPGQQRTLALIRRYLATAPDATHVVMVCGNHDFYGGSVSQGLAAWRAVDVPRLHLLEDASVVLGGVRFWGATMWTDLAQMDPVAVAAARLRLADFEHIAHFSPAEFAARHRGSRAELVRALDESPEPVVVVTHHLPSVRSQDPRYASDPLGPSFYASDLEPLVARAAVWCHGHTHASVDHADHGARVLCNPRGVVRMHRQHVKKRENPQFDEHLSFEVEGIY